MPVFGRSHARNAPENKPETQQATKAAFCGDLGQRPLLRRGEQLLCPFHPHPKDELIGRATKVFSEMMFQPPPGNFAALAKSLHSERLSDVFADIRYGGNDVRLLDGERFRGTPLDDAIGRNQDRFFRWILALKEPEKQSRRLVTDFPVIARNA